MSLITETPSSKDALAIWDLKVSTEKIAESNFFTKTFKIGINLLSSSFSLIILAPGLELAAPISIISAPWVSISLHLFVANSIDWYFPPSKKESGAKFKIPITFGIFKSKILPLQFNVILIQ